MNVSRFPAFIAEFTRLAERSAGDEAALREAGARLLGELVRHDDWLPERCARHHPERYQQYLLHCDALERFSVVSFVWGPGQRTPVHDHMVWGLIGVLRGAELCRSYTRDASEQALHAGAEQRLEPGQVEAVSPAIGDIHEVANAFADRPSISIHVYGANIGAVLRHVYDPATGAMKDFVSGYSAPDIPNFWDRSAEVRAALPGAAPAKEEELIRECNASVTQLTLNRPRKANALSAGLVEALLAAVDEAHEDGTRLLVLKGAGAHFCAGFDFTGFEDGSDADLVLRFIRIETLLQKLYHAPFLTLGLAQGKTFGAGADLIAACDSRIAAPDAAFCMPGLRFGIVLGTRRLAGRIGGEAARDVLRTSRSFAAEEALSLGFTTRTAPAQEWPGITSQCAQDSGVLDPAAAAVLHRCTLADTRPEDMADLVRSASRPGLKERIRAYRSAARR